MTGVFPFGAQIVRVVRVGRRGQRHPTHYLDFTHVKGGDLARIVGQQHNAIDTQVLQHRTGDRVISFVSAKTEMTVRLQRIQPLFLQGIGT